VQNKFVLSFGMKRNSSYNFLLSKKLMELANILTFVTIIALFVRSENWQALVMGGIGVVLAWAFGLYFLLKK
jgi:arginine exporter protein ArgO